MSISQNKIASGKKHLEVMLPDTRGVTISRWGRGNLKLGLNVVTYSKVAEVSCPGSTEWCRSSCYAKRITGPVKEVYVENTQAGSMVPDLPEGTDLVRIHVSGDFDSVAYVERWYWIIRQNPGVSFWAYTRSWRVPDLITALNGLRSLPNIQLFASTDESTIEPTPIGWRVAWIQGDPRIAGSMVCPEETGKKLNCEECGYCFKGKKGGVTFLRH